MTTALTSTDAVPRARAFPPLDERVVTDSPGAVTGAGGRLRRGRIEVEARRLAEGGGVPVFVRKDYAVLLVLALVAVTMEVALVVGVIGWW